jgi:hypothetical protein
MRKITTESVNALLSGGELHKANMSVSNGEMRLHGNLIAKIEPDTRKLKISNAGWPSNTTKERLNGILNRIQAPGLGIYQENFQWYWLGLAKDERREFPNDTFVTVAIV